MSAIGNSFGCLTTGIEGVRFRMLRVDRDQLDVQITEQFERAVQARLIRYPPDQVGLAMVAPADLEAVNSGHQGRAQPSLHDDLETLGTQGDSSGCCRSGDVSTRSTDVQLTRGAAVARIASSWNGEAEKSSSLEGDRGLARFPQAQCSLALSATPRGHRRR
jgi:hypothetical protein